MGIYNETITGKLISRLTAVGTKSEGPLYYILPNDEYEKWGEISVRKAVMLWMKDEVLERFIGETVSITGEIMETKDTITIDYSGVIHNGKTIPASKMPEEVPLSPEEFNKRLKKLF